MKSQHELDVTLPGDVPTLDETVQAIIVVKLERYENENLT